MSVIIQDLKWKNPFVFKLFSKKVTLACFLFFQIVDHPKKVKLRWKSKSSSNEYDVDTLKRIFCKYGDVGEVIVMPNKKDKDKYSALVEMKSGQAASLAVNIERGLNENPFRKIELIEEDSLSKQQTFNR